MDGKYFILIETINQSGGYDVTTERKFKDNPIENEHDAELCYYRKITQYGENPAVKTVRVSLMHPKGYAMKQGIIDNSGSQTEE